MEYRNLGRSGLKVTKLCLGTMMFGGRSDEAASRTIIAHGRDQGINFIDTADVYNGGESERIVGRALAGDRDWWVLATKAANTMGEGPNRQGTSRRWLVQALEDSLTRLETDYVDIFYLHKEDLDTPLEETVRAIGDLIAQGKTRYFGVSNYRSWRIAEICRLCDSYGIQRPVVSQPLYNALNRTVEVEHLPACDHYGLGVFPYSPLARGILTGKYDPDAVPDGGSRAGSEDKRIMETEWRRESLVLAQKIKLHAEARGITAGQFSLAWLFNNRMVTGAVAGPRTLEQWQENIGSLAYEFTAEDETLINELVVTGHASTPGYNDPAYPIEGRVPHH